MAGGSKVTTRGAAKSESDTPEQTTSADNTTVTGLAASMQTIDQKLTSIMEILQRNSDDIRDMKKEQKDIGTSLELCHSNIGDLKELIHNQNIKIDACEKEVRGVAEENVKLKAKLNLLQNEINSLEQYSHRNNVIVYGIPEDQGENIHHVVRRLATALQFENWSTALVDAVHRMGQASNSNPRPIIIKFVSRLDKEDFLRKRKVRRNMKAADLGYASENPIYVNESLTATTRELLRITRQAAKEKSYSQVWTANCNIYVRKEKGKAPAIRISSQNDLQHL